MCKKKVWNPRERNLDSKRGESMNKIDYTQYSVEELEYVLQSYKERLASMIMNPDLTSLIAEVEVIEFILKSKKEDEQEDTELN